ncbi:MAG: hypothetical protein KU28_04265 [Sulfurovum sp. PC08-66]|nr:MAG: hypothetical protein KU28_04265 [Sulfurovum sp. PC08-66]
MDFLIFVISIAILIAGADMVIRSSNALALRLNASHFVVGAFLVALGTSLPEMSIALSANTQGKAEMAMATLIGSSILNVTLIFGSIFVFSKSIKIERDFFKKDALWLLATLILFVLVISDGAIGYFDAFVLLALTGFYILSLFEDRHKKRGEFLQEILQNALTLPVTLFLLVVGAVFLIVGAIFSVDSVTDIATRLHLDRWHSGVMMIAVATALPDLILTILAVYRNKAEIAIANILGSTISNLTLVIALSALATPIVFDFNAHLFDLGVLILASLMVVVIVLTHSYNRLIALCLFLIVILYTERLLHTIA